MQSISERARGVTEMPERERPISEKYRLQGREWARLKRAHKRLKEEGPVLLAKGKMRFVDAGAAKSGAAAERLHIITEDHAKYLDALVLAEHLEDLAKIELRAIDMEYGEWQSNDANARRERHMGRQAT